MKLTILDTVTGEKKTFDSDYSYILFLRPDEMIAICYVCSGAMWSLQIIDIDNAKKP